MLRRKPAEPQAVAVAESMLPHDLLHEAAKRLPADKAQRVRRISTDLITLHWLMALFFILSIGLILLREYVPLENPLRPYMKSFHMTLGQGIFVLALLRLIVRWHYPMKIRRNYPHWMVWAMHTVTVALYGVMFVQPVIGVMSVQSGGNPVSFLGWTLPELTAPDKLLHSNIKEYHQILSYVFYGLFGLHVGGALMHHLYLKDATLDRMLGHSDDDFKTTFVRFVKGNIIRRPAAPARPEPQAQGIQSQAALHRGPQDSSSLKSFKKKSR